MDTLSTDLKLLMLDAAASQAYPDSIKSLIHLSSINYAFNDIFVKYEHFLLRRVLNHHRSRTLLVAIASTPPHGDPNLSTLLSRYEDDPLISQKDPDLTLEFLHKAFRFAWLIHTAANDFLGICHRNKKLARNREIRDTDEWEAATYITFILRRYKYARWMLMFDRQLTEEEDIGYWKRMVGLRKFLSSMHNSMAERIDQQTLQSMKKIRVNLQFYQNEDPEEPLVLYERVGITVPVSLWVIFGWDFKYEKWFYSENRYEGSMEDLRALRRAHSKILLMKGEPDPEGNGSF